MLTKEASWLQRVGTLTMFLLTSYKKAEILPSLEFGIFLIGISPLELEPVCRQAGFSYWNFFCHN